MKYTNPLYQIVFMDSCAFDPKREPETSAVKMIFEYYSAGKIHLTLTKSVHKETRHQNTPLNVRVEADYMVVAPNSDKLSFKDKNVKHKIWKILTGNGKPEKMKQDAAHVFEAHRFNSYFVTADVRIHKLKEAIHGVCNARIVLPSELLELMVENENS